MAVAVFCLRGAEWSVSHFYHSHRDSHPLVAMPLTEPSLTPPHRKRKRSRHTGVVKTLSVRALGVGGGAGVGVAVGVVLYVVCCSRMVNCSKGIINVVCLFDSFTK